MAIRYGTSGDDVIVAQSSTDTLVGLDGNDTFDFTLVGTAIVIEDLGGGTDTIRSAIGLALPDFVENLILVGLANSVLTGNTLANRLEAGGGNDTLDGGTGNDTLVGGGGNDVYLVDSAKDVVTEAPGGGTDEIRATVSGILAANVEKGTLVAGSIATILTGNLLDNTLVGNELANVVDGAAGNDTISGNDGNDTLRGGDGNDTISGDAGNDSIDGGNGNDTLSGLAGDDRLTGGAGNDSLVGGSGRDTLVGGAGNDTYVLAAGDGADVIIEAASGGIDTVLVDASILSFTAATGIEAVIVSGANDFTLIGNAAANTLVGGTGADRIEGLAGNDAIDGGAGADTMIGGLGNDQYVVDNAGDQVIELAGVGSGNDRVFSSLANYTLAANVERLMLVGQSAALVGTGNGLDNIIDGNEADNRLEGGAGNDWLDGHAGIDTLVGGKGNDTFVVDVAGDTIVELATQGNDGSNGANDLVRVAADITYTMADGVESAVVVAPQAHVIGNRGANTITGGAGGDILDGGRGIDRLIGGTGDDTYYVDNAADTIVENAGGGIDTVYASTAFTLPTNVDRLFLVGAAGAINGTGSAGNDTITGNGSANVLSGLGGNDELIGGGGNDTLQGGEGNDRLDGGTGVNAFDGGNGDDTYVVSGNADTIVDSGGRDLLISYLGGIGPEMSNFATIEDLQLGEGAIVRNGFGNALDNRIIGNSQRNLLDGGAGNDFIDGAGGIDTMRGGLGNDTMHVTDAGESAIDSADTVVNNVITVSGGNDTVLLALQNYTLPAFIENLIYEGTADATLTGNALANKITGASGNDSIDGGTGVDTMIGGAGNDTYVVGSLSDVVTEAVGGGNDTVRISVINALPLAAVILIDLTATTSTATRFALPNVENVSILGSTGLFNITGTSGDNILEGNGSNNTIIGGAGNDAIDGGGGADSMVGGAGDDTYVVNLGNGAATGGQLAAEDVVTELANGGRDRVVLALPGAGSYTLPDFVEELFGTIPGAGAFTFSGNALVNAIDLTLAAGGTISPGLGSTDSVTVRGLASGTLTVADTDGTDFVQLVLSGGISTLDLDTGVDDIRFQLLSGTSTETASFAADATVLVTGAGSLGLNGIGVSNGYTLSEFTGTLTLGATGTSGPDTLSLKLLDVQGSLATSNNAIETFALDSQGSITNMLAVGGVAATSAFSVTGDTTLDLTGIGNSGFNVRIDGFTGARLGLAAQTPASAQTWTVAVNGSATEIAIAAGTDANTLVIDTTGTGGESVLTVTVESTTGTINLVGNQGLSLLGGSGGTVNSTMNGAGAVLRAVFDGASNFNVTSGSVDTNLTGSGGDDRFVFGTSFDSNDSVDGGGGTDTLTATLSAAPIATDLLALAPSIANVEQVTFTVLGHYLVDAEAMSVGTVTVTGAGPQMSGPVLEILNGRGTWDVSAFVKNFKFTAAGDASGVTVIGGTVSGAAQIDTIVGSSGDDVIDARSGTATVTGGAGDDIFRYSVNPVSNSVTTVTDFASGVDHIELSNQFMSELGADGVLAPSLFQTYTDPVAALLGAGNLKYVTTSGNLYYDPDGASGPPGNASLIMTLQLNEVAAPVVASDFSVI